MKPNPAFAGLSKRFWACVRSISAEVGYTKKGESRVLVPDLPRIRRAFVDLGLDETQICDPAGRSAKLGFLLIDYLQFRAESLNDFVKPRLMDAVRAAEEFRKIKKAKTHRCPLPWNKQKGHMKQVAFLTAIINMLIEENIGDIPCVYDPRTLTTITKEGVPIRTLARRVDGGFPGPINPVAIWEVKEYYYTTTFGSRVADGVYETLLDGMELEEMRISENIKVKHCLMLDGRFTWWDCGRSYLCRVIDMLHMGFVDEVLFGYEVVEKLPAIARGWAEDFAKLEAGHPHLRPNVRSRSDPRRG